jgi:hypothetical protein
LLKFNFHQICLNSFKRVWPNSLFRPISLFIRPVYRWIRTVYRQNRPVGDFAVQILNQMDFGRFSLNFTEFGQFFRKSAGSEGANFLVSADFLNTVWNTWNCWNKGQKKTGRATDATSDLRTQPNPGGGQPSEAQVIVVLKLMVIWAQVCQFLPTFHTPFGPKTNVFVHIWLNL